MEIMPNVLDAVFTPLQAIIDKLMMYGPSIVMAMLLLLAGAFLGHTVRSLIERFMGHVKVDHYADKFLMNSLFHRLGLGKSPTHVVGLVAYYVIFLSFLLGAAQFVGLTVVVDYLRTALQFMPKLIAALVVMAGGFVLGHFLGGLVHSAASANGISEAGFLQMGCYWVIVLFSGLLALGHLGIDTAILYESGRIIVGAIALGLAIAFGLHYGLGHKNIFSAPRSRPEKFKFHVIKKSA